MTKAIFLMMLLAGCVRAGPETVEDQEARLLQNARTMGGAHTLSLSGFYLDRGDSSDQAMHWHMEANATGTPTGILNLGLAYYFREGTDNCRRAITQLRRADEVGSADPDWPQGLGASWTKKIHSDKRRCPDL